MKVDLAKVVFMADVLDAGFHVNDDFSIPCCNCNRDLKNIAYEDQPFDWVHEDTLMRTDCHWNSRLGFQACPLPINEDGGCWYNADEDGGCWYNADEDGGCWYNADDA